MALSNKSKSTRKDFDPELCQWVNGKDLGLVDGEFEREYFEVVVGGVH